MIPDCDPPSHDGRRLPLHRAFYCTVLPMHRENRGNGKKYPFARIWQFSQAEDLCMQIKDLLNPT